MDILNCSIEEKSKAGARMNLLAPGTQEVLTHKDKGDEAPREMYLTLLGPEAPELKRTFAKIRNRAAKKKDNHIPSNEELEREAESDSKMLAEITVGGEVFMGGKWVKVDSDNAVDIYRAVEPFRGQALGFVLDPVNFTKG